MFKMKQNIHFVSKPKGHIQLVINMKTTDFGGFSAFKIRPVHQSLYYTTLEIGNENSPHIIYILQGETVKISVRILMGGFSSCVNYA